MMDLELSDRIKILAEVKELQKRKQPAPGEAIDARALHRLIARTEHLEPLRHIADGDMPVIVGGPEDAPRAVVRAVMNSDAPEGLKGLDGYEAFAMMLRIEQMADIEHAAMMLQRNVVRLRMAMAGLLADLRIKKMPPDRAIAAAVRVMGETE